jgi:transcriptional regulator GlxA family with amidase domain
MAIEDSLRVDNLDPRVRRVITLMELHLAEPVRLEQLARSVNISPSYLTHLFRRDVGRSPAQYWRDVRLQRAHDLLQSSFLSVKQVMAAVGWNDPSHFNRDFRRKHGVCPSAVRFASLIDARGELPGRPADSYGPDELSNPPTDR